MITAQAGPSLKEDVHAKLRDLDQRILRKAWRHKPAETCDILTWDDVAHLRAWAMDAIEASPSWTSDIEVAEAKVKEMLVSASLRRGLITCVSGDGTPYVKILFGNLPDAQDCHRSLISAVQSSYPQFEEHCAICGAVEPIPNVAYSCNYPTKREAEPSPLEGDWFTMQSAPRDGTWFRAIATLPNWKADRIVHYADEYDRLPISDDGEIWPSAPTHWQPLAEQPSSPEGAVINTSPGSVE